MSQFFLLIAVIFSLNTWATSENSVNKDQPKEEKTVLEKAGQIAKDTTNQVTKTLAETRARRENASYFFLANYSPLDLLIPSKLGLTAGLIKSADTTWEFEYLRGSISVPFIIDDLGKVTDERFSLIGRSYLGSNSFNLSYGFTFFDFSFHLGDKLLSHVTGGNYPSIDLVEIQSLGFNFAIGNRWTFDKNITFGIDWISWAQPVYVTRKKTDFLDFASNQQDRDDVDKAIKIISYFPRLALLKLQLGILF